MFVFYSLWHRLAKGAIAKSSGEPKNGNWNIWPQKMLFLLFIGEKKEVTSK